MYDTKIVLFTVLNWVCQRMLTNVVSPELESKSHITTNGYSMNEGSTPGHAHEEVLRQKYPPILQQCCDVRVGMHFQTLLALQHASEGHQPLPPDLHTRVQQEETKKRMTYMC